MSEANKQRRSIIKFPVTRFTKNERVSWSHYVAPLDESQSGRIYLRQILDCALHGLIIGCRSNHPRRQSAMSIATKSPPIQKPLPGTKPQVQPTSTTGPHIIWW